MRKQGYKWYAKTLYKPERPEDINELITSMINGKLPAFFKYAKDKTNDQVTAANNSFVNKLNKIIPNPRINCRKLNIGEIDYKVMVNNPDIKFKVAFTDKGQLIKDKTEPLIVKYLELNKDHKYARLLDNNYTNLVTDNKNIINNSLLKESIISSQIVEDVKSELSVFGYSDIKIVDILTKYLYGLTNSKSKMLLWKCYGDIILCNLQKHISTNNTKVIQCVDCNNLFEVPITNKRTCRCANCTIKHKRFLQKKRVAQHRQKCKL